MSGRVAGLLLALLCAIVLASPPVPAQVVRDAAPLEFVVQRVLEHKANRALGIAHGVFQRHHRHIIPGDFTAS